MDSGKSLTSCDALVRRRRLPEGSAIGRRWRAAGGRREEEGGGVGGLREEEGRRREGELAGCGRKKGGGVGGLREEEGRRREEELAGCGRKKGGGDEEELAGCGEGEEETGEREEEGVGSVDGEPISTRQDLCVIPDKHHGLVRGCREILPWVTHVHCIRHLRENFKKFLRSQAIPDVEVLCEKMYTAANTDSEAKFTKLMEDINTMKKEAHDWLVARDVTKWSLVHDGGSRYGTMTTNSSESFNSVLKKARGLPIQGLIIAIYYNLINAYQRRAKQGSKWEMAGTSIFAQKCRARLQRSEEIVREFPPPRMINAREFQVHDWRGSSFKVEIKENNTCTCNCKGPAIYHIPCAHAIAALSSRRIDYRSFVSNYYTIENYKLAYEPEFHYIPDREFWREYDVNNGIIPLIPPNTRRRSGRPRTARIRNTMDENRPTSGRKCGTCHNVGHNSATCPANPANRSDRVRRPNRPPPC